ncbi:MAG: urate hydroxylase PuuD [Myxococcales bacterium]|nr:urate hydroxylase PuuD [Myxococcales bacterium]
MDIDTLKALSFEWANNLFRWLHLVAGVMWVGHLWFFNFVNAQVVKTYDADSKKKVVPELMPRALYFFRWGAVFTWITGAVLLGVVVYMGGILVRPESGNSVGGVALVGAGVVVAGFFLYDALWRSPLAKNELFAGALSFALVVAIAFGLSRVMSGRAAFIHLGGLFGTTMMLNVWMRIWPAQRRIIAGIKGKAPAPDPSVPAMAALRSKHNTYLSVPLMFFMISNHFPTVFGHELSWAWAGAFVLLGFGLAKFLYLKSAAPVVTQY